MVTKKWREKQKSYERAAWPFKLIGRKEVKSSGLREGDWQGSRETCRQEDQ